MDDASFFVFLEEIDICCFPASQRKTTDLIPSASNKESDAYDRMMNAAGDLADLILKSKIKMNEYALEELTIFLAGNADVLREILKKLR